MSKYEVRFCKCGTVHFMERELEDKVFFDENEKLANREIMQVCLRCGATIIRGLDDYGLDEDGKQSYCYYSRSVSETMDGVDSAKYHIILSKGTRLMMQSGDYATGFRGDVYIDEDALVKEIGDSNLHRIYGISHWKEKTEYNLRDVKAINVNMDWLLRDITPEQAESMCGYLLKSFNWVGTPYEKDFHR